MVTAELAVAVPVLVLMLVLALAGVRLALDEIRCLDAARSAARLLARGDTPQEVVADARARAPDGAVITMRRHGGLVTVVVRGRLPVPLRHVPVPVPEATSTVLREGWAVPRASALSQPSGSRVPRGSRGPHASRGPGGTGSRAPSSMS